MILDHLTKLIGLPRVADPLHRNMCHVILVYFLAAAIGVLT